MVWILALTVAANVAAQDQPTAQVELRRIPLGVYDKNAQPLPEVRPEQLRLKGLAATVRGLEPVAGPRRVVLLLDVSGSMRWRPKWQAAKRVAEGFLHQAAGAHLVALDCFERTRWRVHPFTQDPQGLVQALAGVGVSTAEDDASGPRTALIDALAGVVAELAASGAGGSDVVLVSDGVDNASKNSLKTIQEKAVAVGVRISAGTVRYRRVRLLTREVVVGEVVPVPAGGAVPIPRVPPDVIAGPLPPLQRNSLDDLRQLIDATSGTVVETIVEDPKIQPKQIAQWTESGGQIAKRVQGFYWLELELARPLAKPRGLKIELVDDAGRKRKNVVLIHPKTLLPVHTSPR